LLFIKTKEEGRRKKEEGRGKREEGREHLSLAFIVRASPLASIIRERGRSHYNKKMLFAKLRCSQREEGRRKKEEGRRKKK